MATAGEAGDDAGQDDPDALREPEEWGALSSDFQDGWHAGIDEGRRRERESLDLDGIAAAAWARAYLARAALKELPSNDARDDAVAE